MCESIYPENQYSADVLQECGIASSKDYARELEELPTKEAVLQRRKEYADQFSRFVADIIRNGGNKEREQFKLIS